MTIDKKEKDEIDFKEIWFIILDYKKSILFFIIAFVFISSYIVYFKPNIYSSEVLLKLTFDRQGYYDDFLMVRSINQNSDIEDELVVFQTDPIIQKALEKINIGTRYFTINKYKEQELYQSSPFSVFYKYISPELYGLKFRITPLDEDKFLLETNLNKPNSILKKVEDWLFAKHLKNFSYKKICRYDEDIESDLFTLKIHKIYKLANKNYFFSIVPNQYMVGFIKNNLDTTTVSKGGSIVSLKFYDTVPKRASDIVNSIAQAYIDNNLDLKSKGAKKQLHFIDMQLDAINKTLKGSSEKLQKYKATNIVVNLSNKANITANKLSDLESKKYEITIQLQILQSMLSHIKQTSKITDLNLEYIPVNNKNIESILEQIQLQMARYSKMSVHYTEKYPGLQKIKQEILFLVKSLKQALENSILMLQKKQHLIQNSIDEQKSRLKNVPKQEQELESLTRHFMVNEKIYSYLLEKRAETAILASSTISNTRIIQKANIPEYPIKPKRKLIVFISLIFGIIFGIIQALIREYFNNKITTLEDITKSTNVPVYSSLPFVKNKKSLYQYMEIMRTLWVNISFLGNSKNAKLISITSSISGEGKTFTIYNLSKVIVTSTEKKVIVIDMDMRKPSLHEKFNIQNDNKGLSTLLSEQFSLNDVIKKSPFENLDIIFSGPKAPNPTRLILSENFDRLIFNLKKYYDYILIDTPPIGIVSDAMKVIHRSDLVLYVVKANYSSKDILQTINELDRDTNLNIGIVLNGIDIDKSYYKYGYNSNYTDYYISENEEWEDTSLDTI